jgi:F0F1-type ATP synthase assembly protein I
MILFLCFGFAAGIRGVVRAVKRADHAAQEDARG